MNVNEMTDVDLPSLQSITLSKWALWGRHNDKSCSLKMRSKKEMILNDRM